MTGNGGLVGCWNIFGCSLVWIENFCAVLAYIHFRKWVETKRGMTTITMSWVPTTMKNTTNSEIKYTLATLVSLAAALYAFIQASNQPARPASHPYIHSTLVCCIFLLNFLQSIFVSVAKIACLPYTSIKTTTHSWVQLSRFESSRQSSSDSLLLDLFCALLAFPCAICAATLVCLT